MSPTGAETGCPLCGKYDECPGEHELVEAAPLRARLAAAERQIKYQAIGLEGLTKSLLRETERAAAAEERARKAEQTVAPMNVDWDRQRAGAYSRGAADKRAQIVVWLRLLTRKYPNPTVDGIYLAIADALERGDCNQHGREP